MQKIIAKYGLAAHLSFLTVAPLFLYLVGAMAWQANVMLGLSSLAAVWTVLSPSKLAGERLHEARARAWFGMRHDWLFWLGLGLTVVTVLTTCNSHLTFGFDWDASSWRHLGAGLAWWPRGTSGSGNAAMGVSAALTVVWMALRHSLGRSARRCYLQMVVAGTAVCSVFMMAGLGVGQEARQAVVSGDYASPSFVGLAFGLTAIGGLAAWFEALAGASPSSRKHGFLVSMALVAIVSWAAFSFSPGVMRFELAALLGLGGLGCAFWPFRNHRSHGFILGAVVLSIAVLLAVSIVWGGDLLPTALGKRRECLIALAERIWKTHPVLGAGAGTFGNELKLMASGADWAVLSPETVGVPCAWARLAAERGLVGGLMVAAPTVALVLAYVRRLRERGMAGARPSCLLLPLAFGLMLLAGQTDESCLRGDAVLVAGALGALATRTFAKGPAVLTEGGLKLEGVNQNG